MLVQLQERSTTLYQKVITSQLTEYFVLGSDKISPLKHLYLKDPSLTHSEQQNQLKHIVDYVSYTLPAY